MTETVLVTGGTGFIARWCIVELLERGSVVKTTVRSPEDVTAWCWMLRGLDQALESGLSHRTLQILGNVAFVEGLADGGQGSTNDLHHSR